MNAMTARLVNSSATSNSSRSSSKSEGSASKKAGKTSHAVGIGAGARPSDGRRANKPLMEKRRRARINQSLAVLKTLILDSARLENTKHSKLEKADILELTVRHLQRQRTLGSAVLSKYRAGFQECTREVSRFLDSSDLLSPAAAPPQDPGLKQRLLRHLDSCVAELDLDFGLCGADARDSVKAEADSEARPDSSTTTGGDENNNSNALLPAASNAIRPSSSCGKTSPLASSQCTLVSGSATPEPELETAVATTSATSATNPLLSVVQVIPSRLPDGQVVFLLPSHYVQLAAAAAASTMQPSPPDVSTTAGWEVEAAPSGVRYKVEELDEDEDDDDDCTDQPIDFTLAKDKGEDGPSPAAASVKDEGPVWRPW